MTTTNPNSKPKAKRPRGRPAKDYPTVPDTFEAVIEALVQPVKDGQAQKRGKGVDA